MVFSALKTGVSYLPFSVTLIAGSRRSPRASSTASPPSPCSSPGLLISAAGVRRAHASIWPQRLLEPRVPGDADPRYRSRSVVRADHDLRHDWGRAAGTRVSRQGCLNTTQQVGGALGLAILSTVSTTRVTNALHAGAAAAGRTHARVQGRVHRGRDHLRRRCASSRSRCYRAAGASPKDEQVEAMTISFVRCPGAPYCGHLARVVAFGRRMRGALPRS